MLLNDLITFIRQRHNVVADTFWSDDEIRNLIYGACQEMCRDAYVIENTYTTSTVIAQREYAFPTNTMAIRRITWNGIKLNPITFREDDQLTGLNESTSSSGNPQYYAQFNDTLYLRPIPSSVQTLKIYSYNEPQVLTSASSLEIPSSYHIDCVDYALSAMHAKEKNFDGAQYWRAEWEKRLKKIVSIEARRRRSDSFTNVNDVETMTESFIGSI